MNNGQLVSFAAVVLVTAGLAVFALRRPGRPLVAAVKIATGQARMMIGRMIMGVLAASFLAELLPKDLVGEVAGGNSGWTGILLASVLGALVPTGPMVLMPVVVALIEVGVGLPQAVAFLSSWSLMALHRVVVWELPMMGPNFTLIRLLASIALVPLSAYLAQGLHIIFWE